MKRKLIVIIAFIIAIVGVTCFYLFGKKETAVGKEYTVEFFDTYENYCNCTDDCGCPNGPKLLNTIKVKEGEKVTKPENPKQEGRTFIGWTLTNNSEELYDFDTPVTKDIELYSKWK